MKLPYNINTNTTTGQLKIVDSGGYLTATICANSISRTKTLEVKTEETLDANFDAVPYIAKAKEFEKELYDSCFDEAPSIEASVLAIEIAKYCSPQTKAKIKTEIKKGRDEETNTILVGF